MAEISEILSFDNHYLVVTNGNHVVKCSANIGHCLRVAERLARDRSLYVEVMFQQSGGNRILIQYWN